MYVLWKKKEIMPAISSYLEHWCSLQFYWDLLGDYYYDSRHHVINHLRDLKFPFEPTTRYTYSLLFNTQKAPKK